MANKAQTFEACIKRLDEIVSLMESGETTLDESLKLFEEGAKLAATCNKLLTTAEQKITKLTQGPDGAPLEQELMHNESE